METDIGNPIEYDPTVDSLREEKSDDNRIEDEREQQPYNEQYYYQPQPTQAFQQPAFQNQLDKTDLFANVEKSTWIIAFAVFLLGFFMGKTMQPVILRYT